MNSVIEKLRKAMLKKGYSIVRATVRDSLWLQSESDSMDFEVTVELFRGTLRVRVDGKIVQGTKRILAWISTVIRKGIKFACVQKTTISREAASALHRMLGGSGLTNHYALAENVLERPVRSFTDLTPEDERRIRQYMIKAFRGVA